MQTKVVQCCMCPCPQINRKKRRASSKRKRDCKKKSHPFFFTSFLGEGKLDTRSYTLWSTKTKHLATTFKLARNKSSSFLMYLFSSECWLINSERAEQTSASYLGPESSISSTMSMERASSLLRLLSLSWKSLKKTDPLESLRWS